MKIIHIIGGVLDTIIKIALVVVIVTYAYKYAMEAYNFGYRVFAEGPVSEPERAKVISIYIPEGATAMEIGDVLEQNGLISDARLFLVQEFLSGHHGELSEGKYELSSDMTPEEMIKVLTADIGEDEEGAAEAAGTQKGDAGDDDETQGDDGTEGSDGTLGDDEAPGNNEAAGDDGSAEGAQP